MAKIKKNSLSIKEESESGKTNVSLKRKKSNRFEDVEQNLFDWFISMGSGTPGLTGNLLLEKARQIARKEGFDEAEISALDINWINRFKNRRNIVHKNLHGEVSSVDFTAVSYWKDNVLDIIRTNSQDKDTFDLDETGIFYKMLPNSTHVLRGETCKGGKRAKDRLTLLVGAIAEGEQLPLLAIGRHAKPRCFKNAKVPIKYVSNKKAWMTSDIFKTYMKKLDSEMRQNTKPIVKRLRIS